MGRNFAPARREKQWVNIGEGGTLETFTANATQIIGVAAQTFESRATILRVRGTGLIFIDNSVLNDLVVFTMGLVIVTSDAFAVGDSAMPDPADDQTIGWLWHGSWVLGAKVPLGSTEANQSDIAGVVRFDIDSKAMRKTRVDETLVMVGQYVNLTGNPPLSVGLGVLRCLTALS